MPLTCPLCSVPLTTASLEAHLRLELAFPRLLCLLCRCAFFDEASARRHFDGPLAKHLGAVEWEMGSF